MNRISRHRHIEGPGVWRGWLEAAGFEVQESRYYSHRDTMLFDLSPYLSAPSMLTRLITGRWALFPKKGRYLPLAKWLAPFSTPGETGDGAYLFFRATKRP